MNRRIFPKKDCPAAGPQRNSRVTEGSHDIQQYITVMINKCLIIHVLMYVIEKGS